MESTTKKPQTANKSAATAAAAASSTAATSSISTAAVASVASVSTSKSGEKSTSNDIVQVVSKESESVVQSAAVSMKGSILGHEGTCIGSCDVDDITPPTGMVSFSSTNTASPDLTPAESTGSKTTAQQPRVQAEEYVQFASDQAGAGGLGSSQPNEQQEDTSLLSSSNPAKSGLPSMSTRSKTATAVQKMTDSQLAAKMAGDVGEQIAIARDTHSNHSHWANSVAADLNAGVSGLNHPILPDDSEVRIPHGASASAAATNATMSGSGEGKLSEYELLRLRNIQRNNAILDELGLSKPVGAQLKDNSTSNKSKRKRKTNSTSVPVGPPRQSNRTKTQRLTFTQEESCAFIRKEAAKGNHVKVQPDDGILSREQIQTMDGVEADERKKDEEEYADDSSNKEAGEKKAGKKGIRKEQAKARSEEVYEELENQCGNDWVKFANRYPNQPTQRNCPPECMQLVEGRCTSTYSLDDVRALPVDVINSLKHRALYGLLASAGLQVQGKTAELKERLLNFKFTGEGPEGYGANQQSELKRTGTTGLNRLDKLNPLDCLLTFSNHESHPWVYTNTANLVISHQPARDDGESNLHFLVRRIGKSGGLDGTISAFMSWIHNYSNFVIGPPSHPFLQKSRVKTSSYENVDLVLIHPDLVPGFEVDGHVASMRKW